MSDILSIGGSAIAAYQRALGTVSNNIANLNTEGYSRQDVTLGSGPTENRANVYLGTGVVVTGVKRAYSEFAANSLRSSFISISGLFVLHGQLIVGGGLRGGVSLIAGLSCCVSL